MFSKSPPSPPPPLALFSPLPPNSHQWQTCNGILTAVEKMLPLFFFLLLHLFPLPSTSDELPLLVSLKASLSLPEWDPLSIPDHCQWSGVTCDPASGHVTSLNLKGLNLSGEIPGGVITSLRSLKALDFSSNSFSGPIPESLVGMNSLQTLDLSSNRLSGLIRVGPNCQNLIFLRLSGNFLVGKIPPEIGRCTNLKALLLDRNVLEGRIPLEIGAIGALRALDVSRNSLTDRIPREIGKCRNLSVLVLTNLRGNGEEFNAFIGGIPSEILQIPSLEVVWAPRSNIDGRLVKYSKKSCRLRVLNLGLNYISGEFPQWLAKCRDLEFLDLSSNYLEGDVPEELSLGCMNYFNVSRNSLSGSLQGLSNRNCSKSVIFEESFMNAYYRDLFQSGVGNGSVILHDFSWNNFSGSLPSLPLAAGRNFSYGLYLNNNGFNESITGKFFTVRGGLNGFSVNLSSNQIPGVIQPLSSCLQLKSFEAADNKLGGSIPIQLGEMTSLKVLDLSRNCLTGKIPQNLANASNIEVLLLHHNLLFGEIPQSLSALAQLATFDVSFNNLSGEIPEFKHSTNCDSFKGNQFLEPCRNSNSLMPSRFPIDTEPSSKLVYGKNKLKAVTVAAVVSSSVIVFVLVILTIVLISGKRKLARLSSLKQKAVVIFSNSNTPELNYESIITATRNFSIQNLIGTGGFGATYKAELAPGFLVAVKRLSIERFQGLQQFDAEIKTLGRIKHKNLVTLLGYHMGEVDTFLIYNYLSGGNLEAFIRNMHNNNVNWQVIHKIALDIAQAIVFLHYSCVPRIVHRDIKPSNILLDDNKNAYLSDFGLARLLEVSETHATTDVAGTFGYVAPEYATTCRVSNKSDVYSYGVVLLELVSGKRSLDSSFSKFGNGFNIVNWGRLLIQEGRSNEFFSLSLWEASPKENLVAMLRIALSCTVESLAVRPSMKQVLEMLKQLKS